MLRAIKILRYLTPYQIKILLVLESHLKTHEYVPIELLAEELEENTEKVRTTLSKLHQMKIIKLQNLPYEGACLNFHGFDCLALEWLYQNRIISGIGSKIGVGKEADVYEAITPKNEIVAVKFHRLGRPSFKQTRRKRDYAKYAKVNWLIQSEIAAQREYTALKRAYYAGVSTPKPIAQNRHVVVMELIQGRLLSELIEPPEPEKLLMEILENIAKLYKAKIVHGDLSAFNITITPECKPIFIDFPQMVWKHKAQADALLERDVRNIVSYFKRKWDVKLSVEEALSIVKGYLKRNIN